MTVLLGGQCYAQTATIPQPSAPTITVPSAPAVAPVTATTSSMSTAPAPTTDVMQQLQKVLGKKSSQESLSQVMVIGTLLGCTQKTAGKEATQAFYQEMQTVGKTVESYCKQGNATEARVLLLSTFEQNKDNAVVQAALGCYDQQANTIAAMGGEKMAAQAANYARWARDPSLAEKELKETDVCKKARPVAR